MEYPYFIGMLKQYLSPRIGSYVGSDVPEVNNVPSAFALVFHDIIGKMSQNVDTLCASDERIIIKNIRQADFQVRSNLPMSLKRVFNGSDKKRHLICYFDYIVCPLSAEGETLQAYEEKHLVIDFTSGQVCAQSPHDFFLGEIPHDILSTAWTVFHIKRGDYSFPFNRNILMDQKRLDDEEKRAA